MPLSLGLPLVRECVFESATMCLETSVVYKLCGIRGAVYGILCTACDPLLPLTKGPLGSFCAIDHEKKADRLRRAPETLGTRVHACRRLVSCGYY